VVDPASPAPRPTVRAIVLDGAGRVLLQSYLDPGVHRPGGAPHTSPVWIAPGGGLRPGEDPADGLVRELLEETGLHEVDWGPWLWRRTVELHYQGRLRRFIELYRLARVKAAQPPVTPAGLESHEHGVLRGHRWWDQNTLRSTTDIVYPPRLAERLRDVLSAPAPAEPIDISADG
jgi:8-oxo-dGTP pyrophosphatase MutT (NUDIX family)